MHDMIIPVYSLAFLRLHLTLFPEYRRT